MKLTAIATTNYSDLDLAKDLAARQGAGGAGLLEGGGSHFAVARFRRMVVGRLLPKTGLRQSDCGKELET